MSINLLETIQQNLGCPVLQKIDPNTQEVVGSNGAMVEHKFSQAAIPAIVVGLYRFVQSDEGALFFLTITTGEALADKVFENNKQSVIETIDAYANQPADDTATSINVIAGEALKVIRESLSANAGVKEVKSFFVEQRNNILLYLPPALKMGVLLDDNTLDDNIHKMEGPISSFMQNVSNLFSKPVDKKEADKLHE